MQLGSREGFKEVVHLSHTYEQNMKVWVEPRLGKGIFGKRNSTSEDAKLGIKGSRRMPRRFLLFSDCTRGCLEDEVPAQRLAMGRRCP